MEPSHDNLVQIAGHERDNLDAVGRDHGLQRPGDGAANERANAQFSQTKRLLRGKVIQRDGLRLSSDPAGIGLHDVNLPGYVKDRRDSIAPGGECRFHRSKFEFPFRAQ